ncbi:MAG: AAA family ATPase [Thermoplasmatota archaeon]
MRCITISGPPGAGTTTVSQLLSEKTNIEYIYAGNIFRTMAEKYNMSLEEFGQYCENHREIDEKLDAYQLEILKKGNVILEGRIAGWIAYRNSIDALKILITADLETRVQRIIKREQGDFEKRMKEMRKREISEKTRYKKYYDIDLDETLIYDFVIDSSNKTAQEIVDIIRGEIKK